VARKAKPTLSCPSSEAIEARGTAETKSPARSRVVRRRSAGGSGPEVAGVVPPPGFRHLPGWLDRTAQAKLLAELLALVEPEGWFEPVMPRSGRPFSVRMANLGPLGWVSDLRGYRYQPTHPLTGRPWPPIPERLLAVWQELVGEPEPECCLVNFYGPAAKMGLHRDADEDARDVPVLSISLGDTAIFRVGGLARRGPTVTFRLASGDVVLLAGESRHAFHGIDRILAGSSDLLPGGGRINLTLRRVTRPAGGYRATVPGLSAGRRRTAGPGVP
jgi:alkylated DNA repair protein (DNA oxidative demethylase)